MHENSNHPTHEGVRRTRTIPKNAGKKGVNSAAPVDLLAVDGELRFIAKQIVELPWLETVKPEDPRFWFPAEGKLGDWIQSESLKDQAHPRLAELVKLLGEADQLSFADEVKAVAVAVKSGKKGKPGNAWATTERIQRWADIFVARYVAPEEDGRTLQDVGAMFGITRERVRQMVDSMMQAIKEQDAALPSTVKVLAHAAKMAPIAAKEVNEQSREVLGQDAGILSAIAFAKDVGLVNVPVKVSKAEVNLGSRQYASVATVVSAHSGVDDWSETALRLARKDCNVVGCTTVVRIAGLLALQGTLVHDRSSLMSVLGEMPGFRWLDRAQDWFTFGDAEQSSGVALRVRKIMAVAPEMVNIDEISAALIGDWRWLRDGDLAGIAYPPVHVLTELLAGWDWLESMQSTRFRSRNTVGLQVLNDSERVTMDVILQHDGVAAKHEFAEVLSQQVGVTPMAISAMSSSSVILKKVDHGLYALRGHTVSGHALDNARKRVRNRSTAVDPLGQTLSGDGFSLNVTDASLRNEQYGAPARYREQLKARRWSVEGLQKVVTVSASGAIRGINGCFPQAKAGDRIAVSVQSYSLKLTHYPLEHMDGDSCKVTPSEASIATK